MADARTMYTYNNILYRNIYDFNSMVVVTYAVLKARTYLLVRIICVYTCDLNK